MVFIIYLIGVVCLQVFQMVCANGIPYLGRNAANFEQRLPFSHNNGRGLETNRQPAIATNGIPEANKIIRNEAIANVNIGNANIGNANIAQANYINPSNQNANRASVMNHVNPSTPYYIYNNLANPNDIKLSPENNNDIVRSNIQGNYVNIGDRVPNYNFIHPDLTNQQLRSDYASQIASNTASPLFGNIVNNAPNTLKSFSNSIKANPNIAGLSSYFPNSGSKLVSGNIANPNCAQDLANGKLPNTIMPGATFSIGGNPFRVLSGSGNQPIGLRVVADSLEVSGLLSVSGKMPFHGTVSLRGSLPVEGTGTVKYRNHFQSFQPLDVPLLRHGLPSKGG